MLDFLPPNWLPALVVFLAVGMAVVSLAFLGESLREVRRRRDFRRQLEAVAGRDGPAGDSALASVLRDRENESAFESVLTSLPQVRDLKVLLEQADLAWTPGTFLTISIGLGAALSASAFILAQSAIPTVLAGLAGMVFPLMYVKRLKKRRIRRFEEQFPEAIDLLGRSIRAGHAFPTGLKVVAEESPEPMSTEFQQIFDEQKFGLPLDESLLGLADRIDLVDVRIFVTAILIQREVGGNLAEILDKISYTIRERFTLQRQIRVYTAQGRLTGYILAGLPILLGLAITALNPTYMAILFEEPMGKVLIAAAAILQFLGFLLIRRIIDIEI
ncbi:MAG: type II secretion system F family protein [Candidatus Palauibacterales bacterium]|nr:type II secretion system F family protein [Candidatus Palauibacterales bacterium]MDP2482247.1 type II secretion system F family protein [Candidatus Palauibacterales bacterium]